MNPCSYLEQWFGFLFPPPLPLQSVFEKQGQDRVSPIALCFVKSTVCDDNNFEMERNTVHLTPEASGLQNKTGVSKLTSRKGCGRSM